MLRREREQVLNEELKGEIQQAYSRFLNGKGLRARYGQRLMIAHIARSLTSVKSDDGGRRRGGNHLCVVEAGTGTGKTLAYTLAAVPCARALDKTLVISTATVALQEQILQRDLPDILHHSGMDFSFALAKGRRRYLCQARLDQILSGTDNPNLALYPDELVQQPDSSTLAVYQQMADALVTGRWDGDRDQWADAVADEQWLRVTTDHAQCTGRRCSFIKQCSFFQARDSMGEADVIVANHDLVLADLALGGGAILPPPEDCIYVLDEAHHLPDKVLGHFSFHLRYGATERWLEQSERAVAAIIANAAGDVSLRGPLESLGGQFGGLRKAMAANRPLLDRLLEEGSATDNRVLRFPQGIVPPELRELAESFSEAYQQLLADSDQLIERLQQNLDKRNGDQPREMVEQWLAVLSGLLQRIRANAGLWAAYAVDGASEDPPQARWLQMVDSSTGMLDVEICCSPILAAKTLTQALWSRCHAAVLTSATLTALGNFDRFSMRAGLASNTEFFVVPSPFRYGEVAELYIPDMRCDPRDPEAHTRALVEILPGLIKLEEGTLVLFASRRQMETVYAELPESVSGRILMQGAYSKQEILRRHIERIDQTEGSIIFGLASFAEGVDLPGDYCRHVVIAKIPFAVPDDPVEQALGEWITENKGNPFFDITVPDAALRLVQASGRLLRNEQDSGRISVLDRRLVTQRYGQRMLDSLPPYRRIID